MNGGGFLRRQPATTPNLAVQRLRGKSGTCRQRGDFQKAPGEFQIGDGEGFRDWPPKLGIRGGRELDCFFQLRSGSTR